MSFELLVLGFNHLFSLGHPSPYLSTSANKDNIQQLLAGTIATLALIWTFSARVQSSLSFYKESVACHLNF
jgi:hypothetical protein